MMSDKQLETIEREMSFTGSLLPRYQRALLGEVKAYRTALTIANNGERLANQHAMELRDELRASHRDISSLTEQASRWNSRAATLEAELELSNGRERRLREQLEAAQLRSIEARNPGIDMERVKRERAGLLDDTEANRE